MTILGTRSGRPIKTWYAERFWNLPVASGMPTGFTSRHSSTGFTFSVQNDAIGGSISGKEFKFDGINNVISAVSMDRAGAFADGEVLVRGYAISTSGGAALLTASLRIQGSDPNVSSYRVQLRSLSNAGANLRLESVDAGTLTNLANPSFSWSANTRYFLRLRVIGTNIRARAWQSGTPEPSTWNINVNNSTITGAGYAGFGAGAPAGDPAFDYIAVAIGGGTAPRP